MNTTIVVGIITAATAGLVGYLVGAAKSFRQKKIEAYESIVLPLIKAHWPEPGKRKEAIEAANKALYRMWVFCSPEAALAGDDVANLLVDPRRGKPIEAMQKFLAEARSDVQPWPWSTLFSIDYSAIKHFYLKVPKDDDARPQELKEKSEDKESRDSV